MVIFSPIFGLKDPMTILCERMVKRIWEERHLCGFSNEEIERVLEKTKEVMAAEDTCLELKPPLVVIGDTHGQLSDLINFLKIVEPPPASRLLFLGDYVDRSKKGLEVIMLIFCYKILYPDDVFLLRGNHECFKINRVYGFYREMKEKRNTTLWHKANETFNEMPLCALIARRIFCCHGGLSPKVKTMEQLKTVKKLKTLHEQDDDPGSDFIWADPCNDPCIDGFRYNSNRLTSYQFDEEAVKAFCQSLDLDFICRAHEIAAKGHEWKFNNRLVTVFSAPAYLGGCGNSASVMRVSQQLEVSFVTLTPKMPEALNEKQREAIQKMGATNAEPRTPDPHGKDPRTKSKTW